jgi:enoyl-CoA hydratase/carnithine racemase
MPLPHVQSSPRGNPAPHPEALHSPDIIVQVRSGVGYITLNRPRALNTLNLTMVRTLHSVLIDWENNDAVKAVVVQGSGEKAFCAGGDVRIVHEYIAQNHPDYEVFFEEEYALNQYIYHYPKLYIAALHGIVMGGGMGIAQGADLRLVDEHTQMAMPENAIGLFPDVGASYFLTRHNQALAIYLGLVGKVLNGKDALFCRLADWYLPHHRWPSFFSKLEALARCAEPLGSQWVPILTALEASQNGDDSPISHHIREINTIFSKPSLPEIFQALTQHKPNAWVEDTWQSLQKNSPLAMHATQRLLTLGHGLGLSECFKLELELVKLWKHKGEFTEGVRAALIDKDKSPQWKWTMQELTPARLALELPPLFGPHP